MAIRIISEVPYPFKETANIFLQTKGRLCRCFNPFDFLASVRLSLVWTISVLRSLGVDRQALWWYWVVFLVTGICSSSFLILLIPVGTWDCITVFWIIRCLWPIFSSSSWVTRGQKVRFFSLVIGLLLLSPRYEIIGGLNVFLWKYFYVALLRWGALNSFLLNFSILGQRMAQKKKLQTQLRVKVNEWELYFWHLPG